jgi:hypothetical protein
VRTDWGEVAKQYRLRAEDDRTVADDLYARQHIFQHVYARESMRLAAKGRLEAAEAWELLARQADILASRDATSTRLNSAALVAQREAV